MVAYSFQKQFVEPILAGAKQQTIRANRRRHARPGEELQLYTGMRTKHCKLIARATCRSAEPIRLSFNAGCEGIWIQSTNDHFGLAQELDHFARRDGFPTWFEMRAFWKSTHGTVEFFDGVLIRWGEIRT